MVASLSAAAIPLSPIVIRAKKEKVLSAWKFVEKLTTNSLVSPGFEEQKLQDISGVTLTTNGHPGQLTSIKIQGAPANYNRVLWNGLSMSELMVDASLIPFSTGSVEVIKGVHCAEYGNGAIGGAVNVLPFSMPENQGGGLKLGVGNYARSGHAWWRQKAKDGFSFQQHVEVDAFYGKTTIPKRYQAKYPTVMNPETQKQYFLNQLVFCNHHVKAKLDIGFVKSTSTESNILPSFPVASYDSRAKRGLQIYALDLEGASDRIQPFLKILKTKLISQDFSPYQSGSGTYGPENNNIKAGARIKKNTLIFEPILEYHHNVWNSSGVNQKKNDECAFIQGVHVNKDTFQWKNWVRVHKANHYDTVYAVSSSMFKTFNNTEFSAHFGTGFNIPDLYMLNDKRCGNKSLKHESGYGGNLGIAHQTALGAFSLLVFKTYYKHQIVWKNVQYQNVNRARQQGAEVGWKKKIHSFWMVEFSSMYADSVSLRPKKTALNIPRISGSGRVTYSKDDVLAGVGCRYIGTQIQPDFEQYSTRIKRGGYVVFFGDFQYKFEERVAWFVNVENALSKKIENPYGYRNPGFQVNTGINIIW